MSDQPEYIQLEAGDDIHSVRDRLSFIRGRRVLIIWPETGTAMRRKLDLVLVQREARRRVLQIAFVTHDEEVIRHARELGISTFETIGASKHTRWKRGRGRVFTQRFQKPEADPEPEELMNVASRVRTRRRISRIRRTLEKTVVLLVLAAVIFATGYVVVPGAEVHLTMLRDTLTVEATIVADPSATDVDIEQAIIPANVLRATVRTSRQAPTTGTENLGNSTAIGVVVFTNDTGRSIVIPEGTIVSTSAGSPIRFQTVREVTLPGGTGQRVEAAIEAMPDYSGEIGNVETGLINTVVGDLAAEVTVRNLSPTTGGETRTFNAVTAEDRESLMRAISQELQTLAVQEMEASLPETQQLIVETVHIPEDGRRSDWINFSHEVGDLTATFSLEMQAIVEAVAIDDRFARQIILARLSAEKPAGLVIQPDTLQYERGGVVGVDEQKRVSFIGRGTADIVGQYNPTQLKETLAGRDIQEANRILQRLMLAPGTSPRVQVVPEWFDRMPFLPVRIRITMDTAQP